MFDFNNLKKFAATWKAVKREELNPSQKEYFAKIVVEPSKKFEGEKIVVFYYKDGGYNIIPLSKESGYRIGDEFAYEDVTIVTLQDPNKADHFIDKVLEKEVYIEIV